MGIENKQYAFFPRFEFGAAGAGLSVGINGISVIESSNSYLPAIAVYEGEIGSDWNHIMVVYNNKEPTIFLNGQLVHSGPTSPRDPLWAPIQFGGYLNGFFDGQMDKILIYNRALAPPEVEQLMLRDIEVASDPAPFDGESDVDREVVLSWKPGVTATQHDVFFGSNADAVDRATATADPCSVYMGRQVPSTYAVGRLDFGQTYYWKVNEVNEIEDPILWAGDVWSFTVVDYLVVDDFESYNDFNPDDPNSNRVFSTWLDGWQVPTNGSVVGYPEAPFCEQTIVHEGNQSMPLYYDNTVAAVASEAGRTQVDQDGSTL